MYNKVILAGNLTRDIEVKFTNSGLTIANTAIATSRKFKAQDGQQKEEVMFMDITFFGRSAEVAQQYLHKGSKVLVEGRLKFDQWVDQNGGKRSKHSISVESMQMLDTKKDSMASSSPDNHPQPYGKQNNTTSNTTYERPTQQTGSNTQMPAQPEPLAYGFEEGEEPPF